MVSTGTPVPDSTLAATTSISRLTTPASDMASTTSSFWLRSSACRWADVCRT